MTAQIRPNRMEVSDRFPMLGFSVRVSEPNVEAEVVLANDISLFNAENQSRRNANNFYTSRENGTLMVPRGDGVFVVAPEVLQRFIGSEKIYFGLATGHANNGGLTVDALPREGSPYVSLRGFTGRTLRRSGWTSRRMVPTKLDWAGDVPRPGSENAVPGSAPARKNGGNGNGIAHPATDAGPAPTGGVYDDGFGPMPVIPARQSAYRGSAGMAVPGRMGIMLSGGSTARDALNWIIRKVEQAAAVAGSDVSPPSLYRLGGNSSTFISAWETVFGLTSFIAPANAFLAALPGLARDLRVTLSIGPALDTPVFGAGVGVVFAPNGQVALFGAGEISVDFEGLSEFASSLKAALQAKMKLGYNSGGIDGFESLAKVASVNVGEELVVGAELWLDGAGSGLGGAVSIGVGFALQLAAEQQRRPHPRAATMAAPGRVGIMLSSGTTARDALDWIMRKVEQAVDIVGSDVSPPSLYRLGGSSGTFISAWEAIFNLTSLFSPGNAFLAALPGLARDLRVTLSIGPALDTPVFGGGVGVVFAPNGQVALFGAGDISVDFDGLSEFVSSLKVALQAKMKLGYNSGGIEGFASLAKVASVNAGGELVVGAELWLDGSGSGIGGAVSIGVGFALQLAAEQQRRPRLAATAMAVPTSRLGMMLSSGTTARDALNWIMRKVEQAVDIVGSDVSPPSLYRLGGNSSTFISAWETVFGLTSLLSPGNAFLAALPSLARDLRVTLSIGPALDTPVFGAGVGVVFAPNGQVALFGAGEISVDFEGLSEFASSLKAALQAKMKLGYNNGGIEGFASLAKVASVNVGEEIVVGAELWLDGSGSGLGGAVSIGVGFALQLAAEQQKRARMGATALAAPTPRVGIMLSSGTTARDALNWIMHKVEQAVDIVGSNVSPPSLYRLGGNSSTFISAWETAFGLTSFIAPANAFLAALPGLARDLQVTLSIGPALDTPVFGGGVGVVFAPNGQVALFGAGEISVDFEGLSEFASSLKAALQAKMKLGYNNGGIEGFASLAKVASVNVGEEIVVGAELWLDGSGSGLGGAVSIGVGFALQLAADRQNRARMTATAMSVPARRMGIMLSGGTTAQDALGWIMRKVEQAVALAGSNVSPPSLYRLGGNSSTFISAWETVFGLTSLFSPTNAFFAALPGLATSTGVTLSIGPALDTPVFGGGVGVVFAPNGQVALFGSGEMNVDFEGLSQFVSSLKLALQAKMKLGYNNGGIEGFASLAKVASFNVGEELVVGAELWLDGAGSGLGGAVSIGVGFALQLAADRRGRTIAMDETGAAIVPPALPNDQRARATRIGGPFAGRLHEALDLGLNPKALDALLDTLDPPVTPQPLGGAPSAQAMGAGPRRAARGVPVRRARQMDVGAAATIAGTPVTMIAGNAGSISWNVPQWTGIKHPNGQPPAGEAAYQDGVVMLNEWPRIGGTAGVDDIYAWFRIRWQFNGTSLGRIQVEPSGSNDSLDWGLTVTGMIEDDANLYPRNADAAASGPAQVPALRIVMSYVFGKTAADSHMATSRITLFADGTHQIEHGRPTPAQPREVAYAG